MTDRVARKTEVTPVEHADRSMAGRWAAGYGAIRHSQETQQRVAALARRLQMEGVRGDGVELYALLHAADRLASAGMWLVAHQTYAQRVRLDGRALRAADFKTHPEGHTGGALNMVPAYVGYLAANALTGFTRSWLMGQGHTVAAVDSVNLLVGDMTPAHAARYNVSDEGLTRYVQDFYSYRLTDDGRQDSPLGSHVNAHTAGGIAEGGYLGFAELQYVHMPLPGERLVAFLSDGAFEEQRGSDWAPRWWRAEDSGWVTPIMINNGRRIDQRTTMAQEGGVGWFQRHLRLNNFDPMVFDGRDPAAFAWAILEMERRLEELTAGLHSGKLCYPVRLPYGIAVAPKGAGFYGSGTNLAHNLPLGANPSIDPVAARRFNRSARRLWVASAELAEASTAFQSHAAAGRLPERDHPLANRKVPAATVPEPAYLTVGEAASPMDAVDGVFVEVVRANPQLRPRVGNPDEMKSNRLIKTLELLKFRVTAPEAGVPEAIDGAVITALNEEAVASAALGNKGGINLIHSYEAFGSKMHGVLRQEIIFANQLNEYGRPPGWLSVPLVLTSHLWENGKNEQSHQDPSLAEALLGEPSDVSRVFFPADYNTAATVMAQVFRSHGQLWTLVAAKAASLPVVFSHERSAQLVYEGGLTVSSHEEAGTGEPQVVLMAIGAYQLQEALRAAHRLAEHGIPHQVSYLLEPGRFRAARNEREARHAAADSTVAALVPPSAEAVVVFTHTRPEPMYGVLAPLWQGRQATALGFINQGGTLDTPGMLWVNRATWAHGVTAAARLLSLPEESLLTRRELQALQGLASPAGVII